MSSQELAEKYRSYAAQVVGKVMRSFGITEELRDELESAAYLALVESSIRYDTDKGTNFLGYAAPRIRGAVIDQLGKSTWYKRCRSKKRLELLKQQTELDCAGESPRTLQDALSKISGSALGYVLKFSAEDPDEIEGTQKNPEAELLVKQQAERLRSAMAQLRDRERFVIEKIYFEGLSLNEIGELFMSQQFWNQERRPTKGWLSKIHCEALNTLRNELVKAES